QVVGQYDTGVARDVAAGPSPDAGTTPKNGKPRNDNRGRNNNDRKGKQSGIHEGSQIELIMPEPIDPDDGALPEDAADGEGDAGLIGALLPPSRAGHAPRLWHLTDFGLAALALDQGADPVDLATRNRLRGRDLLARLPGLPHLLACYELLGALAAAGPGGPDL